MKFSTVFQAMVLLYVIEGVTLRQDPTKIQITDLWHTLDKIQSMMNCQIVPLENGKAKPRSNGRVVKYNCKSGFQLVGKPFSTCIRGRWNTPPPVCVARGCDPLNPPVNGHMTSVYRGAVYSFTCDPGYQLTGSSTVYCDRYYWNSTTPTCNSIISNPATTCDFENSDLCGWNQDAKIDVFDWSRSNTKTPSGFWGTGPSFDHTFGKNKTGYYMYIEASSPRRENDNARLFSPIYNQDGQMSASDDVMCFHMWYHMYGSATGSMKVYLKVEDSLSQLWSASGDHGDQWLQTIISFQPASNKTFQLVIEATRGSGYSGDSAIDDVSLLSGDSCTTSTNSGPSVSFEATPMKSTEDSSVSSTDDSILDISITTNFMDTTENPQRETATPILTAMATLPTTFVMITSIPTTVTTTQPPTTTSRPTTAILQTARTTTPLPSTTLTTPTLTTTFSTAKSLPTATTPIPTFFTTTPHTTTPLTNATATPSTTRRTFPTRTTPLKTTSTTTIPSSTTTTATTTTVKTTPTIKTTTKRVVSTTMKTTTLTTRLIKPVIRTTTTTKTPPTTKTPVITTKKPIATTIKTTSTKTINPITTKTPTTPKRTIQTTTKRFPIVTAKRPIIVRTTPSKVKPMSTTTTLSSTTIEVEITTFVNMGQKPVLPPWIYMKKTTTLNPNEMDHELRLMAQTAGGAVGIPAAIGIAIVVLVLAALVTAVAVNLYQRHTQYVQEGLNEDSDVRFLKDGEVKAEFVEHGRGPLQKFYVRRFY